MNKYFMIENAGEVNPMAFYMMGMTSKTEQSDMIGKFGTGFKYGIAAILRKGYEITIFSGRNKYVVSTKQVTFRDKAFSQIIVKHGRLTRELSITTDMGKLEWNFDKGMIELISNALDEGGYRAEQVDRLAGEDGCTRVYISAGKELKTFIDNFDMHFAFRRQPIYNGTAVKVYEPNTTDTRIYRKGVCVYITEQMPVYHYDLPDIDIGEDRKSSGWDVKWALQKLIGMLPVDIKRKILEQAFMNLNSIEANLELLYRSEKSNDWKEILDGAVVLTSEQYSLYADRLSSRRLKVLPYHWIQYLKEQNGVQTIETVMDKFTLQGWEVLNPSRYQEAMLDDAFAMFSAAGYDINRGKIVIAKNMDDAAPIGQFIDGKYYINEKAFIKGLDEVMCAVFEEYLHDQSNQYDNSRGFQNALLEQAMFNLRRYYYAIKDRM